MNSFFFGIKPSDTIIAVIVVPMLAPMIIGIADSSVNDPDATIATTKAEMVELL